MYPDLQAYMREEVLHAIPAGPVSATSAATCESRPGPHQLHLLGLAGDARGIIAQVTTISPQACCPVCRQPSSRVHSH
jgi:hypothetical protein